MSEITVLVDKREVGGKNVNRRLRASGYIPAVVYGGSGAPVPIKVETKVFQRLIKQKGGEHAVFLLQLTGTDQKRHTMVREIEIDPVSREILHVDFQRVRMTEKVKVPVGIELLGLAEGVKNQGGVLDFVTREVEIECLPGDIPPRLELDVSALEVGHHLEAQHLALPKGVTLIDEPGRVIVSVAHSRVSSVVEEAESEAAGEVLIEAEEREPEVIGRGKSDEAEEVG